MTLNPYQSQLPSGGPMSVEAYLQLDKRVLDARYEYVDGVARLMSGGSFAHARIARNVANAIDDYFTSGPCSVTSSDMQVFIGTKANGKKHYVYPDVTVSCDVADRRRDNTLVQSPRIVVEVLSPSTEKFDRGKKLDAYKACPCIQEVVLIDQFAPYVELYRRNEEEIGEDTWEHNVYGPDATVELVSVDVYLSMDEIYKGIDFEEPLLEE